MQAGIWRTEPSSSPPSERASSLPSCLPQPVPASFWYRIAEIWPLPIPPRPSSAPSRSFRSAVPYQSGAFQPHSLEASGPTWPCQVRPAAQLPGLQICPVLLPWQMQRPWQRRRPWRGQPIGTPSNHQPSSLADRSPVSSPPAPP